MKKVNGSFVETDAEKDAKPVMPETKRVPFETPLKCVLTNDELLVYAREMSTVNAEAAEIEAEAKSIAADYKNRIAGKENRREMLGRYISTGIECRTVKCERVFDYETRTVTEVRTDDQTPTIIGSRNMTEAELQAELALEDR